MQKKICEHFLNGLHSVDLHEHIRIVLKYRVNAREAEINQARV